MDMRTLSCLVEINWLPTSLWKTQVGTHLQVGLDPVTLPKFSILPDSFHIWLNFPTNIFGLSPTAPMAFRRTKTSLCPYWDLRLPCSWSFFPRIWRRPANQSWTTWHKSRRTHHHCRPCMRKNDVPCAQEARETYEKKGWPAMCRQVGL